MTTLEKQLRKIAKSYNVELKFDRKYSGAWYVRDLKLIILGTDIFFEDVVIQNFFHEIGHHLSIQNKKFMKYYNKTSTLKDMLQVCVKAEHYADKLGNIEMKKYFPDTPKISSYTHKDDIKFLKNHWTETYKQFGKK